MNLFDMSPFKEKDDAFRRLLDVANLNALTPKERAEYDENLKIYRDRRSTLEYAVEEAEEKGMERGIEKGIEKGVQRTAQNMKAMQIPTDIIVKATGLTSEEIDRL